MSLIRAYFDVNINDGANIRLGQFITPAGIWNEDHASPVVLTISQPSLTSISPIFPESQLGWMFFGRQYLGDHDLNYNIYVTSGRSGPSAALTGLPIDNAIDSPKDLTVGGHVGLKLDMLKGISIGASALTGMMNRKYQSTQASLDLESLLQGATLVRNIQFNNHYSMKEREIVLGGDAKVEVKNFTIQGEYSHRNIDNHIANGSLVMQGGYGMLAYKHTINSNITLSPYFMYEKLAWKSKDAGVATIGDGDINGFSLTEGGLNLSLYTNFHIKAEFAQLQLTMNKSSSSSLPTDLTEDDLVSNVFSTQFSVAF